MADYQLINTPSNNPVGFVVKRAIDGVFIPVDPGNSDYQTYLVWLDAGNEPDKVNQ